MQTPTRTPGSGVVIEGECLRPGPLGLTVCEAGTRVFVHRCDDETNCLYDSATSMVLAETTVASGVFRLTANSADPWSRRVVIVAEVADASERTTFRTVVVAPIATLGSSTATTAARAPIHIDPSTEGSTRAAAVAGLDDVPDADLRDLEARTRSDPRADYTALSSTQAAERALEIALDLLFRAQQMEPLAAAVSSDGAAVYVAGAGALALLARNAESGDLSVTDVAIQGIDGSDGLEIGVDVALSPDGSQAYVANFWGTAAVFTRDPLDGRLRMTQIFRNGKDGVTGIDSAQAVGVSPDGLNVYVVGGKIAIFSRDPQTGLLTFSSAVATTSYGLIPRLAISRDGASLYVVGLLAQETFARRSGGGLERANHEPCDFCLGIVASPDSRDVYVASSPDQHNSSVTLYVRQPGSSLLTASDAVLVGAFATLGMADDGRDVYVMSDNAHLDGFTRDLASGVLSYVDTVLDPVTANQTEAEARDLAVAPDGRSIYAVARYARGISIFDRLSAGRTEFRRFVQVTYHRAARLSGASGVAVSLDGRNLYVVATNEDLLAVYSLPGSDGALRLIDFERDGMDGVTGLKTPWIVVASADGRNVYVVATVSGRTSLAVFDREPLNGRLHLAQVLREGETEVRGLDIFGALTISPDGRDLYAGGMGGVLAHFSRDPLSGHLHFAESLQTTEATNVVRNGRGAVLSADGRSLYLGGSPAPGRIGVYRRDAATGGLELMSSIAGDGGGPLRLSPDDRFLYTFFEVFECDAESGALRLIQTVGRPTEEIHATDLAISPDGANLYTGWWGILATYARDAISGQLTLLSVMRDMETAADLAHPQRFAFTPAGDFVYVANASSLLTFRRDPSTGALTYIDTLR